MSIAQTFAQNFNGGVGGSPYVFSVTPTGAPSIIVLGGYYNNLSFPTSVTYGGNATTAINLRVACPNESGVGGCWAVYIVNPPTGTQTVSIAYSGSANNINCNVTAYTGTGVSPLGNDNTGSSSTGSSNVSLTTAIDSWILVTANLDNSPTMALNTVAMTNRSGTSNDFYDSNGTTGVTSNTIAATSTGNANNLSVLAFELLTPAAATANGNFLSFM